MAALPHYAYRDPALIVESNEIHGLGCMACGRAEVYLGRAICPNNLKYPACRHDPRRGFVLSAECGGERQGGKDGRPK